MSHIDQIISVSRGQWSVAGKRSLQVRLARSQSEVRLAQQLRFDVFQKEMSANQFAHEMTDADQFDDHCQHLIVIDKLVDQVVGTYRILSSEASQRSGGFYSEQCFRFDRINDMRGQFIELGRSCIHPEYRDGSVLRLLWSGLAEILSTRHERYIIGCPSVSSADGGLWGAAVYKKLTPKYLAGAQLRVSPLNPLPVEKFQYTIDPVIPPLVRGYLRMGALIAGEPHHDEKFGTVDLFMILPTVLMVNRIKPKQTAELHPDLFVEELALAS